MEEGDLLKPQRISKLPSQILGVLTDSTCILFSWVPSISEKDPDWGRPALLREIRLGRRNEAEGLALPPCGLPGCLQALLATTPQSTVRQGKTHSSLGVKEEAEG